MKPRRSAGRLLRMLGLVGLGGLGIGVAGLVVGGLWLRSESGNAWLQSYLVKTANAAFPDARLEVEGLRTNLWNGLELEGVRLSTRDGRQLIAVERLDVGFDASALLHRTILVNRVEITDPVVDLRIGPDGELDLLEALGLGADPQAPSKPWGGLPTPLVLADLRIESGQLHLAQQDADGVVRPVLQLDELDMSAALTGAGRRLDLSRLRIGTSLQEPALGSLHLDAALRYEQGNLRADHLDLDVGDTRLALEGWVHDLEGALAPGLGLTLAPLGARELEILVGQPVLAQDLELRLQVAGPMEALLVTGSVAEPGSEDPMALLTGLLDLARDPMGWDLTVDAQALPLDQLLAQELPATTLVGRYQVGGQGLDWRDDMIADLQVDAGPQVIMGEELPATTLRAHLEGGKLRIDEGKVRHRLGTAWTVGEVDLLKSRALLDAGATLGDLRQLSRFDLPALSGSASWNGKVTVDFANELDLHVEGPLLLRNFLGEGFGVDEARGPVRVDLVGEELGVHASLEIQNLKGPQLHIQTVSLEGQVDRGVGGLVATIDLVADEIDLGQGAVQVARVAGRLDGGIDSADTPRAAGNLEVDEIQVGELAAERGGGPIAFSWSPEGLVASVDLARADGPLLNLHATGNLLLGDWLVDEFSFSPVAGELLVATRPARFTLSDSGVRGLDAALEGTLGAIELQGTFLPEHLEETDLTVAVEDLDLVRVGRIAAAFAPGEDGAGPLAGLSGGVGLSLHLAPGETGPLAFDGRGHARGLSLEGVASELDLDFDLSGSSRVPELAARISRRGHALASARSRISLDLEGGQTALDCAAEADAELLMLPGPTEWLTEAFPLLTLPGGDLSGHLRLEGPACDPALVAVLAASQPLGLQGERTRVDLVVRRDGPGLAFEGSVATDLERRIRLTGVAATDISEVFAGLLHPEDPMPELADVELWAHDLDLQAIPTGFPLEALRPLVGGLPPQLTGRVIGGLTITGSPLRPSVGGAISLGNAQMGRLGLDSAQIWLVPQEGATDVGGWLAIHGGGELHLQGRVPYTIDLAREDEELELARQGLDLEIEGQRMPLEALEGLSEEFANASGWADLGGHIRGSLSRPALDLRLGLEDAAFQIPSLGLALSHIQVDLQASEDVVQIEKFELSSAPAYGLLESKPGTLSAFGSMRLEDLSPVDIDIDATLDGFWLFYRTHALLATNGMLHLGGGWPGLSIAGSVGVSQARFELGDEFFGEETSLSLDPVIHFSPGDPAAERVFAPPLPPFWQAFDLNLEVDLRRSLTLKAEVPMEDRFGQGLADFATIVFEGDFDSTDLVVQQHDRRMSIGGEVEMLRGITRILGANFKVDGGTLNFTGKDYTDPEVSLTATRQTNGYGTVQLDLQGSLASLDPALSSEDYKDDNDIFSLLLFGLPASELGDEAQARLFAQNAAISAVTNKVAGALGSRFLGQLEVGTESVRVGVPVSDRIFVTYQYNGLAVDNENTNQLSFEWLIKRRLYAEFVTGDLGSSSADLYWRRRF